MNLSIITARSSLLKLLVIPAMLASNPIPVLGQSADQGWYLKPWLGSSQLSDTSGSVNFNTPVNASVATSGGFNAGAALGYQYNANWSAELGWEYRSNDSTVTLSDGRRFNEGNYASNTFALNGLYHFQARNRWQPYVGLGLAWSQEIDLDLEGNGPSQSFAGDGDIGFQAFIGGEYRLRDRWSLLGEIKTVQFSGIDLEGEGINGTLEGLDYRPWSIQFGLRYDF